MAVTASTVNTTDTLETLRLQYNNLKSDVTDVVAEFYFRWTPRFDLFKIN